MEQECLFLCLFVCFLPLFNTHFLASNTESVTGRQSPSCQGPVTFTFKGRKGRWGALPSGRGAVSPWRAQGGRREGRSCTEGHGSWPPWSCRRGWPRKGGPQGRPGDRCSALSHPGLPGHRDGGPGWVRGGESWRYPCLPGPSQGQPARSAPGCPRAAAWRLWLRPGSGAWTPPPTSGAYPSLQRPSLCLSLPPPPALLPPTSHFPLGNVKVQNAETWANSSRETCSGGGPGVLPPRPPQGVQGQISGRSGLRGSLGRWDG